MSTNVSPPAGSPPPAAAAALFERHAASLRAYLSGLQGADAARVESVIEGIRGEVAAQLAFEDDPTVWMFAEGHRRVLTGGGGRGDLLGSSESAGMVEDEVVTGEDPAIAVHRAFGRLTNKQQEVLRLKFQFGFNLAELARITGVSFAGASGLLHSAVERACRAAGTPLSLGEDRRIDVRLTAYALDELEPGERQGFADSVSDGKALLESSESIRKVGAQLARILASGAPLPQRRRKRKAAAWQSPAILFGVPGVLAAGGLAWYFLTGGDEGKSRRDAVPWTVNGDSTVSARTRRGSERDENARSSGGATASASGHGGRTSRAVESNGQDKPFGSERSEREENSEAENTASGSENDSAPAASGGGTRSRGARSGETAKNDPAAEALGQYGASEPNQPAGQKSTPDAADATAPQEAAASETSPSDPGSTARAGTASGMKPLDPDNADKNAPAPGQEKEAGRQAPPSEREPRAAKQSRPSAPNFWPKTAEARVAMARRAPFEKPTAENAAEAPLAVRAEMAPSPWQPDKLLVRVTLKTKPVAPPARPPASLVFAIDVSQSMAGPNRLPLVQAGIRLLAERLRPEDRVSVVTYAANAKEMLPSAPLGAKALELRNCLAELETGGQTNGDEGLRLAYAIARRARVAVGPNVVVLCTDGNFNLGETDEQVLAAQAQQAAAEGITLSVFGFGRSDRNDLRLELLATKGGGRSCYVNTREEAEQLLAGQIDGLLTPAARDVSLQVTFDSTRVDAATRLDGMTGEAAPARVDKLLPGRSLSALYEITVAPGRAGTAGLGEWEVDFRRIGSAHSEHLTARLDGKTEDWARTSVDFRFAAAWAELARILKGGPHGATGELDRLEEWVQRVLPDDTGGYRTELLENIAAVRQPAGESVP